MIRDGDTARIYTYRHFVPCGCFTTFEIWCTTALLDYAAAGCPTLTVLVFITLDSLTVGANALDGDGYIRAQRQSWTNERSSLAADVGRLALGSCN
jgi:hypothetical protein